MRLEDSVRMGQVYGTRILLFRGAGSTRKDPAGLARRVLPGYRLPCDHYGHMRLAVA